MVASKDLENFHKSSVKTFFVQFISDYIISVQSTIETSDSEKEIFRCQGALSVLKQLNEIESLIEESNLMEQENEK